MVFVLYQFCPFLRFFYWIVCDGVISVSILPFSTDCGMFGRCGICFLGYQF